MEVNYDEEILPFRSFDEPEDNSSDFYEEQEEEMEEFDETGGAWGDYKNG